MNWFKLYDLAKNRGKSDDDYLRFQKYQASEVLKDINKYLAVKKDSFVIDWGCGKGGYSCVLARKYSRVKGVDFYVTPMKNKKLKFESQNLLKYVSKEKADFIFCASVIEHVSNPRKLIENIHDSLKNDGKLYMSFPPFYSIGGGHQLKPFHYLPEKAAIFIGHKLKRISQKVNSYNNLFETWGLYKLSINQIRTLLDEQGFRVVQYKPRYFNLLNMAKIPLLNNILTWHAEFYCIKRG